MSQKIPHYGHRVSEGDNTPLRTREFREKFLHVSGRETHVVVEVGCKEGNADEESSPGLHYAKHLRERFPAIRGIAQDFETDDIVETLIGEFESMHVPGKNVLFNIWLPVDRGDLGIEKMVVSPAPRTDFEHLTLNQPGMRPDLFFEQDAMVAQAIEALPHNLGRDALSGGRPSEMLRTCQAASRTFAGPHEAEVSAPFGKDVLLHPPHVDDEKCIVVIIKRL